MNTVSHSKESYKTMLLKPIQLKSKQLKSNTVKIYTRNKYILANDTSIVIIDNDIENTEQNELSSYFKKYVHVLKYPSIMMKYNILKLLYNKQIHLSPFINHIVISSRILDGYKSMIRMAYYNTMHLKQDVYIICPTYSYKKTNKTIDSQIVITGNVNINETPLECTQREIREEIGLYINRYIIRENHYGTIFNSKHCIDNYMIDLSLLLDKSQNKTKMNDYNVYCRSNKNFIQILLYGTLNDIMYQFKKLPGRYYSNDICSKTEYILDKVKIVNIKDIMHYLNIKI